MSVFLLSPLLSRAPYRVAPLSTTNPFVGIHCLPVSQEVSDSDSEPTEAEDWLEGLVSLLGYFCLNNRSHQELMQEGPPPSILVRLCTLPFR